MGQATCSVIIPAFNHARHLERSIGAALAQTFRDIEVIVVDDGSTDDTPDVMSRLTAPNVIYIRTDNGGPGRARNVGIRASTGKYIQFLDADDFIFPEKIESHVKILEADAHIDIVYCDCAVTQPHGVTKENDSRPLHEYDPLALLIINNPIVTSSALVRKSAVVDAGMFDELKEIQEDWDLWIAMALNGSTFKYDANRLAHYYRGPEGITSDVALMFRRTQNLLEKYRENSKLRSIGEDYYERFIANLYLQLFFLARDLAWWKPAQDLLFKAMCSNWSSLEVRHWLYFPELIIRRIIEKLRNNARKIPEYAYECTSGTGRR